MTIDGFLGCLGLIVAIYALAPPVSRFRLKLQGFWLWGPSLVVFATIIYLLLLDLVGVPCSSDWCKRLILAAPDGRDPKQLAFIIVVGWLAYVALLSKRSAVGARQLPVLNDLVSRLELEKRYGELVDFVHPHLGLIARTSKRALFSQMLIDRVRRHGEANVWLAHLRPPPPEPVGVRNKVVHLFKSAALNTLKPFVGLFPVTDRREVAASRILRALYTNEKIVEYLALDRPLVAIALMRERPFYDHDFPDRAFGLMMQDKGSALCKETLLNGNTQQCFYEIDPNNQIISALFFDCKVAE
jgi:hypothetical protein